MSTPAGRRSSAAGAGSGSGDRLAAASAGGGSGAAAGRGAAGSASASGAGGGKAGGGGGEGGKARSATGPTEQSRRPRFTTGTHWPASNAYVLSALSTRRAVLPADGSYLATELQRLAHFTGARPPNRAIISVLRRMTLYPPARDALPELVALLSSDAPAIAVLAHLHIRSLAPLTPGAGDPDNVYGTLLEALEAEALRPSPARRAAACKTFAAVVRPADVPRALDFLTDAFRAIGGVAATVPSPTESAETGLDELGRKGSSAAVAAASSATVRRKVIGVSIPGTVAATTAKDKRAAASAGTRASAGTAAAAKAAAAERAAAAAADDGAGGAVEGGTANAPPLKSRAAKMLVGHAVLAALRRVQRTAVSAGYGSAPLPVALVDAGLMSVVPSTVRHTIALLDTRQASGGALVSAAVAKYLLPRLPHRKPAPHLALMLSDLGAKVSFARLAGRLARDPNLTVYEEAAASARLGGGASHSPAAEAVRGALAGHTGVLGKTGGLFRFVFSKAAVAATVSTVKASASAVTSAVGLSAPSALVKKVADAEEVEFAAALVGLLKNVSNRVLYEALLGLSRRRWSTWYTAPLPRSALYNAPDLPEVQAATGGADDGDSDDGEGDLDDLDTRRDADDEELDGDIVFGDDTLTFSGEAAGPAGADADDADAAAAAAEEAAAAEAAAEEELDAAAAAAGEGDRTWVTRLKERRAERRTAVLSSATPFYLRPLSDGAVACGAVATRRVHAALLSDESVRRHAAAVGAATLARAARRGRSEADAARHASAARLYEAEAAKITVNVPTMARGGVGKSGSLTPTTGVVAVAAPPTAEVDTPPHPLDGLVGPLREVMDEDANRFVRAAAARAVLLLAAAGAGHWRRRNALGVVDGTAGGADGSGGSGHVQLGGAASDGFPSGGGLLVRLLGSYVTHPSARGGVGEDLAATLFDVLIEEVLVPPPTPDGDVGTVSPGLAVSAVALAERWAGTYPSPTSAGRLSRLWEAVLSTATPSAAAAVAASTARCLGVQPPRERLAASAAAFLRYRALDVAALGAFPNGLADVLTPLTPAAAAAPPEARGAYAADLGLPEPLPGALGLAMEAHSALLWHTALLGPSAEARAAAVTALGGIAALAGEPYRIAVYERLVTLVRCRGLGLKRPAEAVLSALDGLYAARVRAADVAPPPQMGGARLDPRRADRAAAATAAWAATVGGLAAECTAAATILLGCPPPEGWLPLGVRTAVALRAATAPPPPSSMTANGSGGGASPRRRSRGAAWAPADFVDVLSGEVTAHRSPTSSDGGWSIEEEDEYDGYGNGYGRADSGRGGYGRGGYRDSYSADSLSDSDGGGGRRWGGGGAGRSSSPRRRYSDDSSFGGGGRSYDGGGGGGRGGRRSQEEDADAGRLHPCARACGRAIPRGASC